MGGCYSRPKELDGPASTPAEKPAEPGATVKPVESESKGNAPTTEVKAEPATEIKEEPLVDLSEPNPEAEKDKAVELSPEISELMVDTPEGKDTAAVNDAPVAERAIVTEEKEKVVEEKKAEEAKIWEEKVSA